MSKDFPPIPVFLKRERTADTDVSAVGRTGYVPPKPAPERGPSVNDVSKLVTLGWPKEEAQGMTRQRAQYLIYKKERRSDTHS